MAGYLAELNARYAIVDVGSINSDTVVAELDPDTGRVLTVRTFSAFKRHRTGRPPIEISQHHFEPEAVAWLTNPHARRYARIVYAPPGSTLLEGLPDTSYNRWRGFALEPVPAAWPDTEAFLRDIICAGDHDLWWWLLNWLAALVQRPGQHAWTALVLKGGQGIGKGFFVENVIGRLFHRDDWTHLTDPTRLTQQFNSLLANKVLVFADEAVWDSERNANKLKGLITADSLQIEAKNLPIDDMPSTMHLIVASNSDQPLSVERDDRRLCILQVDESRKQDTAYFAALQSALNCGEQAAFLAYLLEHPIDEAMLRMPPDTAAKQQMKARSLPVEDAWWGEVLSEAESPGWEGPMRRSRAGLFESLREYAKGQGRRLRIASIQQLGNYFATHFKLGGLSGWPRGGRDLKVIDLASLGKRVNAWEFPSLALCRKAFEQATGVKGDW